VEPEDQDVDWDGKADDRAHAFYKAVPAFFNNSVPSAPGLSGALYRSLVLRLRSWQDKTADNKDGQGAKDGCAKGDADINDSSSLDHWHRNEEHSGHVEKIGGEGVEQVGQDQLFFGDFPLFVGLGEHGVGADTGKKCHGKGGA